MKHSMLKNRSLQQLGVQAAHIDCEGITVIAEVLTENQTLRRIDARSNHIGEKGLTALKIVLENTTNVHRFDLDDNQGPCHDLVEEIRELCRLNEARSIVKEELENSRSFSFSRKISLTCETLTRHQLAANSDNNFLVEPKRTGRLRSPAPSPIPSPASSPIPSPSRNRFRVSRVSESSSSSGSSISPSSPVSSRFRVTIVEPATILADKTPAKVGFEIQPVNEEKQTETTTKPEEKPVSVSGSVLEDNNTPVIRIDEPPASDVVEESRKRKVSVVSSKPQTGLEKLLGIFQNPGSLFNSVSSDKTKNAQSNDVKNCAESETVTEKNEQEFWDWDWNSTKKDGHQSASGNSANGGEEHSAANESPSSKMNL